MKVGSRLVIGLSLLTLVPGVVGGSETYVRGLIPELRRRRAFDYRVFVPRLLRGEQIGGPTTTVAAYRGGVSMPSRVLSMAKAVLVPCRIRSELDPEALELLHFPLTVMLPIVDSTPTVTSILDVQHEYFPEFFSRAELAYRRALYGRSARGSTRLIAISEHARGTLVERLRVPAERVRVIHLGVDHERFAPIAPPTPTSDTADNDDRDECEPFLLYPANGWPHKNHARLLQAFALARRTRPELRLVLLGSGLGQLGDAPGVETRGRVSDDELTGLYRRASGLVFPSIYEGFGQPPLEAMASGCPVAASNAAALPEICGDAACLFDPHQPDDIARAIDAVLSDPSEYRERGLERAREFSWRRCAAEHERLYAELGASAASGDDDPG